MTQKPNPLNSIKISGPIPAHLARSVIEETLRNAILDGRLPCGTAMRQQELASLFRVNRMPVSRPLRQPKHGDHYVADAQGCSGCAIDRRQFG